MKIRPCPKCKSRTTKIVYISTGKVTCQICGYVWKMDETLKAKKCGK